MQRSKQTVLSTFMVGLATFALTGCGSTNPGTTTPDDAQASNEAPEIAETSDSQGEATFTYGDKTYTADLRFCSLTDGEDALFHGPAHDETGDQVGYLDGDFGVLEGDLHGEARIDFGSTGQFESSDEFIAIGDAVSNIVATDFSDESWILMGGGWDQDGAEQGNVTLKVNC